MKTCFLIASLSSAVLLLVGCGEYREYREDAPEATQTEFKIPERYQEEYQTLTDAIASLHVGVVPQKIGPDHASLHTRLAIIYYEIGEWRKAHENLERGINMYSGDPKAHVYLGRVLSKMERYENALSEFEIALGLDPTFNEVHRELADTYERMGLTEKAEGELKKFNRASSLKDRAD